MIEFGEGTRPSMALELEPHDGQKNEAPLTPDNLFALGQQGPSWHVRLNGRIVAVGGYILAWEGRAILWGYLGANAGPAMPAMTREIKRQLVLAGIPRYEAYAEVRHAAGRRWLKLLGFRKESGAMRKFMLGRDYIMFARVS